MSKKKIDYFDAAQKMFDKGNLKSALHYALLQRNIEENAEILIFIADTYSAMCIYDEAFRYYMRAYGYKRRDPRIIDGILECMRDEDGTASAFYMQEQMGDDENVFDMFCELTESLEESGELDELYSDDGHKGKDWRDQSALMNEAIYCAETGNREDAERMFDAVRKSSYQYESAALASASLKMTRNESDGAIAILDDLIARGLQKVDIYIAKILAHDFKGDRDGVDEVARILDSLEINDPEEIIKISLCLSSYGYFDQAEKHILRALKSYPYDKVLLLCLADARLHQGKRDETVQILQELCQILPDDYELQELVRRLQERDVTSLMHEQMEISKEWANTLSHILINDGDLTTDEARRLIRWAYRSPVNQTLQAALSVVISRTPGFEEEASIVLIDPFVSSDIKKPILRKKILNGADKQIKLVTKFAPKTIEVNPPESPENLRTAYCEVLTCLALEDLFFEKDFALAVNKISAVISSSDEAASLEMKEVAAVLYEISTTIVDKADACSRFDCTYEEFKHARSVLHISDEDKPTKGHAIPKRR